MSDVPTYLGIDSFGLIKIGDKIANEILLIPYNRKMPITLDNLLYHYI